MLRHFRDARFIKIMLWTVALSFIALIVFEWGADFSGRSSVDPVGDSVGSVNGETLSYQQFDGILRDAYQREKQAGQANPDLGRIIRQTWDRFVGETIIRQQVEKYGITASDREIDFLNRSQPPPWVQEVEIFQTEGTFDLARYQQFLNDPGTYSNPQGKQFVLAMEDAARQSILTHKLQSLLTAAARVSDAEVRDTFGRRNEKVRVAYAGIDARGLSDSLATLPDQEIADYYAAHSQDYDQDQAVIASFVGLAKTPTLQDEADIESEIQRLRRQVEDGDDFAELAGAFSDDPGSASRGGDLGFFGRGQMVKPFEERAYSLDPGQVSDPFRTQFGWHILKVEEREGSGDSLRVRARHILLQVTAGRATVDSLQLVTETFRDHADKVGFDAAASEQGLEVQDTGYISAGAFFPLLSNKTTGLVNLFLEVEPGHISPTYESEEGIYIFVLRDRRAAGPQPLVEVRDRVEMALKRQKQAEAAVAKMALVRQAVVGGSSLEDAASKYGASFAEPDAFSREDFVPGVGRANEFVGAAFRLASQGDLSEAVGTQNGGYLIRLLEKISADEEAFESDKTAIIQELQSRKQNQVVAAWFGDLKNDAEIVDNRHHFYYDF